MSKMVDMTGKKYGRLTGIRPCGRNEAGRLLWLFKCDCGNEHLADARCVRKGVISSCGCLRSEICSERGRKYILRAQQACVTHGQSSRRIWRIYNAMLNRCYNERNSSFGDYGARGITVCNEWRNNLFAFIEWAYANGYTDELTIDRIENDKGYSPDNCRWVTRAVQNCNTRQNILITIGDETKTKTEWARAVGVSIDTINRRLAQGWLPSEAVTTPVARKRA